MLLALLVLAPSALLDHGVVQWRKEPETRVQDAYKWLYHATLGGEHAIENEAGPRAWMEREWVALGPPRKGELSHVPLTPDGRLLRVNLRPYRATGGDKERLLAAFIASARRFRGKKDTFIREWEALGRRLRKGKIGKITLVAWREVDGQTRPIGYPAVHHSPEYERAYRPAYRIVLRELWPEAEN
jgi:hypothetical protein